MTVGFVVNRLNFSFVCKANYLYLCHCHYTFFNVMKDKIVSFCWQHFLLVISLLIMTLGVACCVRSALGSSVISVNPFVFHDAGKIGLVPALSIGQYTYWMNALFVVMQIAILRKQFEWVQLFQLVIGLFFGLMLDFWMMLTILLVPTLLWQQVLTQLVGCLFLGIGIAFEVRCGSVTMPGEGISVAVSQVTHIEFPKVKISIDIALVCIGIILCFVFFGAWQWHIIGIGTLIAMFLVGIIVKWVTKHTSWFDSLLAYRPGFRRYIYGLARHLYNPSNKK
jgi:uncharacterized membrane protein YczE